MKNRRSKSLLSLAIGVSLVAVACGSDSNSSSATTAAAPTTAAAATATTAAAPATTAATSATEATTAGTSGGGTAATSLKGVCPDTVVLQTDWMPEAEHGFIYQMVGAGYTIDSAKAYVTGPLIDQDGKDTGVKIQIRSGGAA